MHKICSKIRSGTPLSCVNSILILVALTRNVRIYVFMHIRIYAMSFSMQQLQFERRLFLTIKILHVVMHQLAHEVF